MPDSRNSQATGEGSPEDLLRRVLRTTKTGVFDWEIDQGLIVGGKYRQDRGSGGIGNTYDDWLQLVHSEDEAQFVAELEQSIRRKSCFQFEFRTIHPDGELRWISCQGEIVCDTNGVPMRVIGTTTDITERKQVEEAASAQNSKLAAIVESSDDAIVAKDLAGVISAWNGGAERIFGYTAAEAIGRPITLIIPPELHDEEAMILSRIARGERIDHYETTRVRKTGERVEVSVTISPVRNASGKIVGASKVARDITERKKVEAALRTSEKLAATGRLAATIAHEINNPLEAVVNLLYLARNNSALSPSTARYLELADQELSRIFHITKQTLGFYREGSTPQRTRVSEILRGLLAAYGGRIRNHDIEVEYHVRNEAEVTALAGELRQVFANFLSNSIDAGATRIHVHVSSPAGQRRVQITIGDNGAGISQENRTRIFEPFFTTKRDVGTGLGLWISKEIVERHNGNIRVRSCTANGHTGTIFSVSLPAEGIALVPSVETTPKKRKRTTNVA